MENETILKLNSISSEEKLLRWLHPSQFNWEEKRPTSAAFTDPYMSVELASLTTLEESYGRGQKYGKNAVVSITAEMANAKAQKVCHCPTYIYKNQPQKTVCTTDKYCPTYQDNISSDELEIINPAHGCVIGKKTRSIAKFFANNAEVEIYPPDPNS